MMDELIYRQDAIRWVKTNCNPYGKPTLDYDSGIKVINHLEKMTSVDAVVVVRCKDCKHFKHGNIRPNYCEVFDWSNEKSDFCSFGERKTARLEDLTEAKQ